MIKFQTCGKCGSPMNPIFAEMRELGLSDELLSLAAAAGVSLICATQANESTDAETGEPQVTINLAGTLGKALAARCVFAINHVIDNISEEARGKMRRFIESNR